MSIGLGNLSSIKKFLMLWFGLVGKIKTANQTIPCGWVKNRYEHIQSKCDFFRFQFGLVRFAVFLLYWVLNTPSFECIIGVCGAGVPN